MTKIYLAEYGCKYEGGSVILATLSYLKAWKAIRERRLLEYRACSIKGWWIGKASSEPALKSRNYWEGEYQYFCIREFEDE